jgi:hypothetical protein
MTYRCYGCSTRVYVHQVSARGCQRRPPEADAPALLQDLAAERQQLQREREAAQAALEAQLREARDKLEEAQAALVAEQAELARQAAELPKVRRVIVSTTSSVKVLHVAGVLCSTRGVNLSGCRRRLVPCRVWGTQLAGLHLRCLAVNSWTEQIAVPVLIGYSMS